MNFRVEKHVRQVRQEIEKTPSHFARGFLSGLGWAFGATIGFAIVVGIVTLVLSWLGALPFVGQWFSDLNESLSALRDLRETLPK